MRDLFVSVQSYNVSCVTDQFTGLLALKSDSMFFLINFVLIKYKTILFETYREYSFFLILC